MKSTMIVLCFCLFATGVSRTAEAQTVIRHGQPSEGLASIYLDGKAGYIDKTGKIVIPLKYTWARDFSDGKATVMLDGKIIHIDKKGKKIK